MGIFLGMVAYSNSYFKTTFRKKIELTKSIQYKQEGDIEMGIFENLSDKAVEKFAKKETIRVPYEQIVEILKDEFYLEQMMNFFKKFLKHQKVEIYLQRKNLNQHQAGTFCM